MFLRTQIVVRYMISCLRIGVGPWNYFQLNAAYFNEQEGVFSKEETNWLIPRKWRLPLFVDDGMTIPRSFPTFIKPLWGQNAHGVTRVDNVQELQKIRQEHTLKQDTMPYLVQQAAMEKNEYEIFYIRDSEKQGGPAVFTITQTKNSSDKSLQINSIHNKDTYYRDITDRFSTGMKDELWEQVGSIGNFSIARVAACADSVELLVAGEFHIIEINLFTPMPINLLDMRYSIAYKSKFIGRCAVALAKQTRAIPSYQPKKPIMFSRFISQEKIKSLFQQV